MILIRIILILFLILILGVIHVIQLLSLMIRIFSIKYFRKINRKLASFWWFLLVGFLEKICNVFIQITPGLKSGVLECRDGVCTPTLGPEGSHPALKGEVSLSSMTGDDLESSSASALVISNHQSLIDPLIILIVAKRMQSLSFLKWFVKHSLVYIPFLGWGLWFLDCIFLKRKWEEDQLKISESFYTIQADPDPIWLVSFVEGTRKTKQKLVKSQKFASQRGIQPFTKVLFPRHKGFVATIEELGNRIEFIYNLTIQYENPKPALIRLLHGNLGRVHIIFEKIEIQSLPTAPDELKNWLINTFRKKDALLQLMTNLEK